MHEKNRSLKNFINIFGYPLCHQYEIKDFSQPFTNNIFNASGNFVNLQNSDAGANI